MVHSCLLATLHNVDVQHLSLFQGHSQQGPQGQKRSSPSSRGALRSQRGRCSTTKQLSSTNSWTDWLMRCACTQGQETCCLVWCTECLQLPSTSSCLCFVFLRLEEKSSRKQPDDVLLVHTRLSVALVCMVKIGHGALDPDFANGPAGLQVLQANLRCALLLALFTCRCDVTSMQACSIPTRLEHNLTVNGMYVHLILEQRTSADVV